MTTVYGVTYIGAREQIERQLKDRGDVPIEEAWLAAAYLAKKVYLHDCPSARVPLTTPHRSSAASATCSAARRRSRTG